MAFGKLTRNVLIPICSRRMYGSAALSSKKLDNLIGNLENELGDRPVAINPDDPWASFIMKNFSVSNSLQVVSKTF